MKQLVLAILGLVLATGAAQAQFGRPFQRPTVRPPVNPFAPGGSGNSALTPQQSDTLRLLGQQLRPGQALGPQVVEPSVGVTGHPVRFNYYSHYYTFPFPRSGLGSAGSSRPVAPAASQGRDFGMAPPTPGIGILISSGVRGGE